jgi:hypothetical protein
MEKCHFCSHMNFLQRRQGCIRFKNFAPEFKIQCLGLPLYIRYRLSSNAQYTALRTHCYNTLMRSSLLYDL